MTTDPFTKAAREKAREKWHDTVAGRVRQIDFVSGAAWARDHLAAQETDKGEMRKAQVEALRAAAARILIYPPIDRYGRVMTGARAAAKEIDRLADEIEKEKNR